MTYQLIPDAGGAWKRQGPMRYRLAVVVDHCMTYYKGFLPRLHLCEAESEKAAANGFHLTPYTPPPVPQCVTPRQMRLELLSRGITQSMVIAAIATIDDPVMREAAAIEWEHSLDIRRTHPLIPTIAASLGLTTAQQIDQIFISAATR